MIKINIIIDKMRRNEEKKYSCIFITIRWLRTRSNDSLLWNFWSCWPQAIKRSSDVLNVWREWREIRNQDNAHARASFFHSCILLGLFWRTLSSSPAFLPDVVPVEGPGERRSLVRDLRSTDDARAQFSQTTEQPLRNFTLSLFVVRRISLLENSLSMFNYKVFLFELTLGL